MADDEQVQTPAAPASVPARSKDEVALELMKFIAVTTGFGKGTSTPGFGGKQGNRSPEEHADALLQLFERCRTIVSQ